MEKLLMAELTVGALVSLFTKEAVKTGAKEAVSSLKDGLKNLFKGKKDPEKALERLEKYPEDEDFQKDFNEVLMTALEEPEFASQIQAMLKQVEDAAGKPLEQMFSKQNITKIRGDKNINIQDIGTGVTININTPKNDE